MLILTLVRALRRLWAENATRALVVASGTVVAIGTVFYRFVEDLSWVDALYFTIVTLTTVGYGDIAPETTAGKLFTAVYLLLGIGLLLSLLTELASHAYVRDSEERALGDRARELGARSSSRARRAVAQRPRSLFRGSPPEPEDHPDES
ncbi:MAG: potassium channel family protein [Acidimicrobiales bacterium]